MAKNLKNLREARDLVERYFNKPVADLAGIYEKIGTVFPEVAQTLPDLQALTTPLSNARESLVNRLNSYILTQSEKQPIDESEYGRRVPNLSDYLSQTGEVTITKESEAVRAYCSGAEELSIGERFGVFISGELQGFLDFYDDEETKEIWYEGKTAQKDFVRLIYSNGEREDGWNISFP